VTAGPVDYDAELTRYSAVLRRAWAVQPHDRVLDVGCGTGQTTREAARMAQAGSALGVDSSAPAIERARKLAQAGAAQRHLRAGRCAGVQLRAGLLRPCDQPVRHDVLR
jgi:cyclopropane fatty-acyl-phospholipid synthase-like methyltransferase